MALIEVTILGGPDAPSRFVFALEQIDLGRVRGNQIVCPLGNCSKRHCRVVYREGRLFLVDLKSTNGTYLNGRKVSGPTPLKHTDVLYLSNWSFRFRLVGEGEVEGVPRALSVSANGPHILEPEVDATVAEEAAPVAEEAAPTGRLERAMGVEFGQIPAAFGAQAAEQIVPSHGRPGHPLYEALVEQYMAPVFGFDPGWGFPHSRPLVEREVPGPRMASYRRSFFAPRQVFPGGSLGRWAVFTCVNQLAIAGVGQPVVEVELVVGEGLTFQELCQCLRAMLIAAVEADARLWFGGLQVLPSALASEGCLLQISGSGPLTPDASTRPTLNPGDALLLTGPVGQHEAACESTTIWSDLQLLAPAIESLHQGPTPLHAMALPEAGGLRQTLQQWEAHSGLSLAVEDASIPIRPPVGELSQRRGASALEWECAGCLVLATPAAFASSLLTELHGQPWGQSAAIIGEVQHHP